jgi:hypothetical protein
MTEIKISDDVYAAAGKAMIPFGDDEDVELFEWHHCVNQPNCRGATEPCACSGMPWPSEAVRAAIDAALVASGWRREAPTCQENAAPERFGVFVDTHLHECAREQGHRSAVHRCACNTEWWEAEQYVSAGTREGEDQKRDEEQEHG